MVNWSVHWSLSPPPAAVSHHIIPVAPPANHLAVIQDPWALAGPQPACSHWKTKKNPLFWPILTPLLHWCALRWPRNWRRVGTLLANVVAPPPEVSRWQGLALCLCPGHRQGHCCGSTPSWARPRTNLFHQRLPEQNTCMNRNKTGDRESVGSGLLISVDHLSLQWEHLCIIFGTSVFSQSLYIIHCYKLLLYTLVLQPVSWHWHAQWFHQV